MQDDEQIRVVTNPSINDLFPQSSRLLLTGGGKDFIERIGVEAARRVILSVMAGENVRSETEPLSRRRITQVSGALIALFARGCIERDDFIEQLSELAIQQIRTSRRNDNASIWPAQWLIGLTGKSVQNVLRSDPEAVHQYVLDFEAAVEEASVICHEELGDIAMTLSVGEGEKRNTVNLGWKGILRLTTTVGSQTLTIRGSDKSIYGKLFERLVLGSFLTILGFDRVDRTTNRRNREVFWLSDQSRGRESDATLIYQPGAVARFDIGFIGPGNSEISKDKLSRYERELETAGTTNQSTTFIVVDRLPAKSNKTEAAAERIGAEIVQMSMQYWPRTLAQRLGTRLGFTHELQSLRDDEINQYLANKLASIPIQDFLIGVSPEDLATDTALPEAEDEIE